MSNIEKKKEYSNIQKQIDVMVNYEKEFAQSRSQFVLEKFICGGEHTPLTRYRTTSHNAYVALTEVRRLIIDNERNSRKIKRLEDNQPLDYDLDILGFLHQIEQNEIRIKGLSQEIDFMNEICAQLEKENKKPFTYDQLNKEEAAYWQKRLATQMLNSIEGRTSGAGEGNVNSLKNGMEDSVLPDSINNIEAFNYLDTNRIANIAYENAPSLKKMFIKGE